MVANCYGDSDKRCCLSSRGVDDSDSFGRGGHGALGGAVVKDSRRALDSSKEVVRFEISVRGAGTVFELARWRLAVCCFSRSDCEGRPWGCGGHRWCFGSFLSPLSWYLLKRSSNSAFSNSPKSSEVSRIAIPCYCLRQIYFGGSCK